VRLLRRVWAARLDITVILAAVFIVSAGLTFDGYWTMSGNRLQDYCAGSNDTIVGMGKRSWFPFGVVCTRSDPTGVTQGTTEFTDLGTWPFVTALVCLALIVMLNIKFILIGFIRLLDSGRTPPPPGVPTGGRL